MAFASTLCPLRTSCFRLGDPFALETSGQLRNISKMPEFGAVDLDYVEIPYDLSGRNSGWTALGVPWLSTQHRSGGDSGGGLEEAPPRRTGCPVSDLLIVPPLIGAG